MDSLFIIGLFRTVSLLFICAFMLFEQLKDVMESAAIISVDNIFFLTIILFSSQ